MFVRHGARYPNHKQVNASKNFLEESKLYLDKSYSKNPLKKVVLTFLDKPVYGLSDLGKKEILNIAQRYKNRYPSLFKDLNEKTMSVLSSEKDRCIDSAKQFLIGIDSKEEKITINNRMMRLFSECDQYLKKVDKNHSATFHLNKFKNGIEMMQMVKDFKKRLQLERMDIDPGNRYN